MRNVDLRETLAALCDRAGPSGYEEPAARRAAELLKPFVDEVKYDRLGSVIGVRRCGKPGAKKLLLDAHMDEVGLMVIGMEEGFLRFASVGGVDPRILVDREVTVLADPPRFGVITCLPPHVQTAADRDNAAKWEELFVDVGLSQEEAERLIPVGTPMVFRETIQPLGENRVYGKALDDRSCFAALLRCAELLKDRDLDVDVYFLGSSREEVGGWGAAAAAYAIDPDWCVAVDVTFARSTGLSEDEVPCVLGKGPAVGVGPIIPRWMTERMLDKAAGEDIPCQREIMTGQTGTNGDDFQIAREGVATIVVSLPLRYMHTPVEVIDLTDLEGLARVLAAFARDLGKEAETVC